MQFKPLLYLLMRLRTLLLVSTALLLAVTCDKKKEEPEPQPQPPVTPKIEIPSESQAVFSQGISIQAGTQAQSQTVKFTATAAWSADVADTKASSWLSVQPTSGSAGAVTMTVTAQPNTTDKARSSTVTIQCGTIKQSFTVNQDAAAPQTIAVESVTLNKTELTLEPSGTETLIATVAPDDATDKTVTWTTSNASVATVVDGLVTAVEEGTAIIQASAGDKTARCEVTVKAYQISVSPASLSFLSAGGSKDLKISCDGSWSISGQPSWCIPSTTTGTGDATIQLTVSANNDAKRTGSLTITCSGTTKTVAITQLGGGWQNQAFVHKSLYMVFSSPWCGLTSALDEKVHQADGQVGDKYVRVDVNGRGRWDAMDASPIDFPDARKLENLYYTATPSGILDYRIRITDSPIDNWVKNRFSQAIEQQESVYPPATGIEFESSMSNKTISVRGKIYSHKAETFKLTVYLVENGVELYSNRYDNVLRMSLTETLGDEFVIEGTNSIYNFQYTVSVPDEYNANNLYVLVFVQRQYGNQTVLRDDEYGEYYVDNCRKSKLGEFARLETYEYASGEGNEGYGEDDEITF